MMTYIMVDVVFDALTNIQERVHSEEMSPVTSADCYCSDPYRHRSHTHTCITIRKHYMIVPACTSQCIYLSERTKQKHYEETAMADS